MNGDRVVGDAWDQARALIDLGRRADAAAVISRLIVDHPTDSTLAAWLALCLIEDDPDRSEREAERAVSLAPWSPLAHEALARARWQRQDRKGAFQSAKQVVELAPHDPLSHALLAQCAALHHRYRIAARAADTAVELDPLAPAPWTARAHVQLARQRSKAAARDARRALELDPKHAPALQMLAVILADSGRLDESIDAAEGLARVEPTGPEALKIARYAALRAGGFGILFGYLVARLVMMLTERWVGSVAALLAGACTGVGIAVASHRSAKRIVERDDPRTALRRLRKRTRLMLAGFLTSFVLMVGAAWVIGEIFPPGRTSPEAAVDLDVAAAVDIQLIASGDQGAPWALVAYEGRADSRPPCAAFVQREGRRWRVTQAVCGLREHAYSRAKELPLGPGRAVVGVATADVVDVVRSPADDANLQPHGLDQVVDGSDRPRFVVFLPDDTNIRLDVVHSNGMVAPLSVES